MYLMYSIAQYSMVALQVNSELVILLLNSQIFLTLVVRLGLVRSLQVIEEQNYLISLLALVIYSTVSIEMCQ